MKTNTIQRQTYTVTEVAKIVDTATSSVSDKSRTALMCADLDEQIAAFRQRRDEIANEDQHGHAIADVSPAVWTQVVRQHAVADLLTGAEVDGLPGLLGGKAQKL